MSISRKKICITGASRGIGLAEAKMLQKGNKLFLLASSLKSFKNYKNKNAHLFGYDISSTKSIDLFVDELKKKTKSLDILVNNVGTYIKELFTKLDDNQIENILNVNLRASLLITKKLLPLLLKSRDPQIIFMSSAAAKNSLDGESIYAAAKAGITNFSNVLRNELAGKVRISTIHSWGVNTWGAPKDKILLKPENVAETLEFIITRKRPFLIESIDLSHEMQWRGSKAPWSPS